MKTIQALRNNIPNIITSLNLLAGAIACVFAINSNVQYGELLGYQIAFICIGLASVFDFCDGLVARMLNSVSMLGKELDSLSDCVSFGLAPSMLIYSTLEHFNPGAAVNFVAFVVAVFGAFRLAKFNVDTTQTTSFKGIPIPANAIFWVGYINSCYAQNEVTPVIYLLIATLSLLMVCNLPMFSFKAKSFGLKDNWYCYLLLVVVVTSISIFGVTGFYYSIIAYIIISLLAKLCKA